MSLPLTPHITVTRDPFTAIPFTQHIMSGYQEKTTKHTERQKIQLDKTEQRSEPELAGI